jgi:hypothetical protein
MTATGAIGTAMMRSSRCQPTKKEEYDIGVLLVIFGVFLYVAGRITSRLVRVSGRQAGESHDPALFDEAVAEIRSRLSAGRHPRSAKPPLPLSVCSSPGTRTHRPSLTLATVPRLSIPAVGSDSSNDSCSLWRATGVRLSLRADPRTCPPVGDSP